MLTWNKIFTNNYCWKLRVRLLILFILQVKIYFAIYLGNRNYKDIAPPLKFNGCSFTFALYLRCSFVFSVVRAVTIFTPVFSGIHVAWILVFCVVFCRSLFVLFSFFSRIVFFELRLLITYVSLHDDMGVCNSKNDNGIKKNHENRLYIHHTFCYNQISLNHIFLLAWQAANAGLGSALSVHPKHWKCT